MTLSDYSQLRNQVVHTVETKDNHSNLLQSLKELFRDGINSVRRFEQIKTIKQLLLVLEFRDLLSENNVNPLKAIARELKSRTLLDKINEYEENHEPRNHLNYYTSEKANKSVSSGGFINITSLETDMWKKKRDRIFLTVTEQIGSAWRDLGRRLGIQEWQIDEIDSCGTLATKASKMLKRFYERADREKWHFILCDALDTIRRKELRHTVQEIIMMNI